MDNELIIKALKASITEMTSNSTSEMVTKNILSIQLEEKAEANEKVKNERDEAREQLQEANSQLEKVNKVLQSNEELRALFDKVAEELDKPKKEG